MANVKIIRNVAFIESSVSLKDLKNLAKHRPNALVLKDEDKNELYKLMVGTGEGSISKFGATYGSQADPEKKAAITIHIPDDVKDAKAFDKLTFQVKGDANIVAVDNGNIASDELHIGKTQLEKSIQRNLFQGSALVILRAGDKPGKIELSVAGEKMKAKKLVLNTK